MASGSEQRGFDQFRSGHPIIPASIANVILGAGFLVWVFTMTGHIGRNQVLTIVLVVFTYATPIMGKGLGAITTGSGRRAPFWALYIAGGLAAYVAAMALAAAWWTGGVSPNLWLKTVLWNAVDVIPALDIPRVFGWSPPFSQPGGLQSAILVVVRLTSILVAFGLVKAAYDKWEPWPSRRSQRDADKSSTNGG
jgi:hypothetical protein